MILFRLLPFDFDLLLLHYRFEIVLCIVSLYRKRETQVRLIFFLKDSGAHIFGHIAIFIIPTTHTDNESVGSTPLSPTSRNDSVFLF